MIDIKKNEKYDLKLIYGTEKYCKWVEKYPILENDDIMSWIINMIDQYTNEGKDPAKFNITDYLGKLQGYCIYNGTDNPSELLQEDIDDRNSRLKQYLTFLLKSDGNIEYYKDLGFRKQPSETSVRNAIQSRIKSFFSDRGAPISFGMKTRKSGENKNELYLTKELIKKIKTKLESAQYRLICKFETQCGLRISDVLEELTTGKYQIEKFEDHYFIRNFETQKEKVIINYLFFTKELIEMIQSVFAISDLTQLDLAQMFLTRNNTRINAADYRNRVKEIVNNELGIDQNIKTHAFRKYYTSQIAKCMEIDDRFKVHLEGRTPNYRDEVYNNNLKNIKWYFENWKKTEHLVCVDCIVYDKTNKEILQLKEEKEELAQQVDDLIKDRVKTKKEFKEIKKQLNKQQELVDQLLKHIK